MKLVEGMMVEIMKTVNVFKGGRELFTLRSSNSDGNHVARERKKIRAIAPPKLACVRSSLASNLFRSDFEVDHYYSNSVPRWTSDDDNRGMKAARLWLRVETIE